MDDKVVCRISICTARSPGIGGFHEHIKEGLDYIYVYRHPNTAHGAMAMRGEGRCFGIMSCISQATRKYYGYLEEKSCGMENLRVHQFKILATP